MTMTNRDRQTLYNLDFAQWLEVNVEKLRRQDYTSVDWENLIEELEDMGRSERRRLKSNVIVILLHLLKWQFQPERRSGSWESSLLEHRRRVREALEESPSLRPYLEAQFPQCYREAVKQARAETGLPMETFPPECPYLTATVVNDDFLPE